MLSSLTCHSASITRDAQDFLPHFGELTLIIIDPHFSKDSHKKITFIAAAFFSFNYAPKPRCSAQIVVNALFWFKF